MNELKYCKFCDKEKPIKDFTKSGFAIKNICRECQNKKNNQIYKNSKKVEKLEQENKKLNGAIQTYDILLKSNIEESKQLKAQIEEYQKALDETMSEKIDIQNNWNKLKEYIDIKLYNVEYLQKLCGYRIDDKIHMILDIIKKEMKELEGSDSNE